MRDEEPAESGFRFRQALFEYEVIHAVQGRNRQETSPGGLNLYANFAAGVRNFGPNRR